MRRGLLLRSRILAALLAFSVFTGCDDLPFASDDESDGDEIVQVSTAQFHACTLTRDGSVFCWGDNADGRLGIGSSEPEVEPVRVQLSHTVGSLSAGSFGGCAVAGTELYCWGRFGGGMTIAWIRFVSGRRIVGHASAPARACSASRRAPSRSMIVASAGTTKVCFPSRSP